MNFEKCTLNIYHINVCKQLFNLPSNTGHISKIASFMITFMVLPMQILQQCTFGC